MRAETPGAPLGPGDWHLQSAFQHAIQLQAVLVGMVGELRSVQSGAPTPTAGPDAEVKRLDVHRALGKQGEAPGWLCANLSGAVLEHKGLYDPGVQQFGFYFVYCAYATQLILMIQFYRRCAPADEAPVRAETPGAPFGPGDGHLPWKWKCPTEC